MTGNIELDVSPQIPPRPLQLLDSFVVVNAGSPPGTPATMARVSVLYSWAIDDFAEAVYDLVAGILVAGANTTLVPDDGLNTLTIASTSSGGVSDGDKGDIIVTASGLTWTIDAGVVTLAKMANMATDSFLGRDTAGVGVPEVLTPAQARTILNVAAGATANASDATLLARANHTGTQVAATISDFLTAVLASVLTGFSVAGSRTAIVAADTILIAFGKIQKYLNDLSALAFSGNASDLAGSKTAAFIADFSTAADARIAAASINALADVIITAPSTGQVVKYNGTNWVNDTDATGGGGGSSLLIENVQTGTTYTAVLTDADKLITLTNNASPVFTQPLNASVNFPVGQQYAVRYTGTGIAKLQVTGPATLNGVAGGSLTITKDQEVVFWQKATDVWEVVLPARTVGLTLALAGGVFNL